MTTALSSSPFTPDPFLVPRDAKESEKTVLYAARRVYLNSEAGHPYNGIIPLEPCCSLRPPDAVFMTRRQAGSDAALAPTRAMQQTATHSMVGNYQTTAGWLGREETGDLSRSGTIRRPRKSGIMRLRAGVRKASRVSKDMDEFKRRSREAEMERQKAEWSLVTEAGVRFWLNSVTREATDVCPYSSDFREDANSCGATIDLSTTSTVHGLEICPSSCEFDGMGTGSLVYDPSDMQQVLRILEGRRKYI